MQTKTRRRREPAPPTAQAEVEPVASEHVTVEEIDDWLDDIDAVLEEQAETFVREYIQKGGQ